MKKEKQLQQYVDPTGGPGYRELKAGEWYLRHKILLGKIGAGLLVAWSVVTVGFSLWQWGSYAIVGARHDRRTLARQTLEFPNYEALHPLYGAQALSVVGVRVFQSAPGRYDFVATVRNPNQRWLATAQYHFEYNGVQTPVGEAVLLPGQERPVAVLGAAATIFPAAAQFILDNVRWRQLSAHRYPDVESFMGERLQFQVDDVTIQRPQGNDTVSVPRIAFDLVNNSAYSYWQPTFYVELLSGTQSVGTIFLSVDQFRAGERRAIDVRYFGDTGAVNDIRLYPAVNIFDGEVYIAPRT